MLQNQPVRNLQYDNDIRVAQQPQLQPTVFDERVNITSPRINSTGQQRIALPLITVDGYLNPGRTFLPQSGLEILHDMPSVHIEQTFELTTLATIASDNRYTVRSPFGEAIYLASETSTDNHRAIWGSARAFRLGLLDKTHQEVLSFQKDFSLGYMCVCQPRQLDVWMPPGNVLGSVVEDSHLFSSRLRITSDSGITLYNIEGESAIGCCSPKEKHFKVYSADMHILKGSITRKWSTDVSQYTTNVYFNDTSLDAKNKALFLGAAFLIEYLYFQSK